MTGLVTDHVRMKCDRNCSVLERCVAQLLGIARAPPSVIAMNSGIQNHAARSGGNPDTSEEHLAALVVEDSPANAMYLGCKRALGT